MAVVTACSDFGAQENKVCHYFHIPLIYLHEVMGLDAMIFVFECWVLSQLFHSSFTFIKRLFRFSLLSAIRVVSSAYLRLLLFLLAILIPACDASSPACHMMCSVLKLNKQGNSIQPCTPFIIWSWSTVPCKVLTIGYWLTYRFLRRQVMWSGTPYVFKNLPQFVVIHTVRGFGIVSKAEVDVLPGSC